MYTVMSFSSCNCKNLESHSCIRRHKSTSDIFSLKSMLYHVIADRWDFKQCDKVDNNGFQYIFCFSLPLPLFLECYVSSSNPAILVTFNLKKEKKDTKR